MNNRSIFEAADLSGAPLSHHQKNEGSALQPETVSRRFAGLLSAGLASWLDFYNPCESNRL
jgi:hypothetical protein